MATNPLIPEIQAAYPNGPKTPPIKLLSPAAQNAARMAGYPEPADVQLPQQPPSLIGMPQSVPKLVTGPDKGQAIMSNGQQPTPMQMHQVERNRLIEQGPGEDQLYGKIANSRLGEAHPLIGKLLGGLAEGAAKVGDIGLSAVAPQIAVNLPGTALHHQMLLNHANQAVTQDEANAQREAQSQAENAAAQHTQAETAQVEPNAESERALREANVEHLNAETNAFQNPVPSFSIHDTEEGPILINSKTGQAQHLSVDGQPVGPKLKLTQSQPIMGPDGKPHTYMLDEKGNKKIDLGVHYERPVNVNVGAQNEKNYEYSDKALTATAKPIEELAMRMGRLKDTMAQGSPQADALIAPELLTVMAGGQGSGLRMNEAEIARIVGGRSAWENLKGKIQHWSTDPAAARAITPDQDRQIRSLIEAVDSKMQRKLGILNDARSKLVDISDANEQHRLVSETRKALQAIDTGEETGGGKHNDPLGIR